MEIFSFFSPFIDCLMFLSEEFSINFIKFSSAVSRPQTLSPWPGPSWPWWVWSSNCFSFDWFEQEELWWEQLQQAGRSWFASPGLEDKIVIVPSSGRLFIFIMIELCCEGGGEDDCSCPVGWITASGPDMIDIGASLSFVPNDCNRESSL